MKYVVLSLFFVLSLVAGNLISVSTHDYFYDLKMKECEAIQGSEYRVSTEDVSHCYKIQVNKFWQYDLGYYAISNLIIIFFMIISLLFMLINDMVMGCGRF